MSQLQSHVDELRRRFDSVTSVRQSSSEVLLQVEHVVPERGYTLTLCVALDAKFPRVPPLVTYFGGRKISIAAPDAATVGDGDAWDPARSKLADAVANAFANLMGLWGSVAPPAMGPLAAQLGSLSDAMLQDLVANANCLESYAYQLPFFKAVREASAQTLDDMERVARENMKLQPAVEQLRSEVEGLQRSLAENVKRVQEARRSTPLLGMIGSPESLARTLAADVKMLDAQCEEIAKKLLQVDCTVNKRQFDAILEDYKQKAKERHMMDLKRRAYCASPT